MCDKRGYQISPCLIGLSTFLTSSASLSRSFADFSLFYIRSNSESHVPTNGCSKLLSVLFKRSSLSSRSKLLSFR